MTPPLSGLGADDPRSRHDGLGWVTSALFPDPRVDLHVGTGRSTPILQPNRVQLTSYAVVPSVSRPRFLVPLGSRRVAANSLSAYNALRPRKVRMARSGLSVIARFGGLRLPMASRLTVTAPAGIDRAAVDLTHHLSIELGVSDLVEPAAFGHLTRTTSRRCSCSTAPVARSASPRSAGAMPPETRRRGGSSAPAGRSFVARSPDRPACHLDHELVRADGRRHRATAVRVRGVRPGDRVRVTEALAIARRGGPPNPLQPLVGSPFMERTIQAARSQAVHDVIGDRLTALTDRFARQSEDTEVEFGWWHGDWVPWNLGTVDGRLVAWDWEHSGPDMPGRFRHRSRRTPARHRARRSRYTSGGRTGGRPTRAHISATRYDRPSTQCGARRLSHRDVVENAPTCCRR